MNSMYLNENERGHLVIICSGSRGAKDGFARRRDINKMVGQCLRKHGLWSALAPAGIGHIAEFNAQGWNALHFAASFGRSRIWKT